MKMTEYKFYDTKALIEDLDNETKNIVISDLTWHFLRENKLSFLIDRNEVEIYFFKEEMLKPFYDKNIEINDNIRNLAAAFDYDLKRHPDETIFITTDQKTNEIANLFFGEDSIILIS